MERGKAHTIVGAAHHEDRRRPLDLRPDKRAPTAPWCSPDYWIGGKSAREGGIPRGKGRTKHGKVESHAWVGGGVHASPAIFLTLTGQTASPVAHMFAS
jgi:hypothetical protein